MAEYDASFEPPEWWVLEFTRVQKELGWGDPELVRRAEEIDARGRKWGPSRISRMRKFEGGTIPLVEAVSKALKISPPIVIVADLQEADALNRWLETRRESTPVRSEKSERRTIVAQALTGAVKAKKDQTLSVDSVGEGSPRSPGTRRAPSSRKTSPRS